MRLSEDRISNLAHRLFNRLYNDDLVDFEEEEKGARVIKRAIEEYVRYFEETDALVRRKIDSLKRKVFEGSSDWEILYGKYLEEELNKRRRT